jgi:hypothetical protein
MSVYRAKPAIREMNPILCGMRRGFLENSSSTASISDRPAWPSEKPTVPRLENVPSQSCRRHRRDGCVRRTEISFRLLYGLLIVGHGRRKILWFGVTEHPTAESIANLTWSKDESEVPRNLSSSCQDLLAEPSVFEFIEIFIGAEGISRCAQFLSSPVFQLSL